MGQIREMYLVKMSERTRNFQNEKLRTCGRKQIAKKSCLLRIVTLWNIYAKKVSGMDMIDLNKFTKN